jgi:hypothetical protein
VYRWLEAPELNEQHLTWSPAQNPLAISMPLQILLSPAVFDQLPFHILLRRDLYLRRGTSFAAFHQLHGRVIPYLLVAQLVHLLI